MSCQVKERATSKKLREHPFVTDEIERFNFSTMSVSTMCEMAENDSDEQPVPDPGNPNGVGEGRLVGLHEEPHRKLKPRAQTVLPGKMDKGKLSKKILKAGSAVDAELM